MKNAKIPLFLASILLILISPFVISQIQDSLKTDAERIIDETNFSSRDNKLIYNQGEREINQSVIVELSSGQRIDLSSEGTIRWQFERFDERWKFAFNFSIPDTARGRNLINSIETITFNISGENLEQTGTGFQYFESAEQNSRVRTDKNVVWDYSDIASSYYIQKSRFSNIFNETVFWNESIPYEVSSDGQNILITFNFSEFNFTAGREWSLDPQIIISNVQSYSPSTRNNITSNAYPLSHITASDIALVLYLPFDVDNRSDGITYDYSNHGSNFSVFNGTFYNASTGIGGGYIGGGYTMNGGDDNLRAVGSQPRALNLSMNSTMLGWVWWASSADTIFGSQLFTQCAGGGFYSNGLWSRYTNGNLAVNMNDATILQTNAFINTGQWYHVAYTRGGVTGSWNVTIYVNGRVNATILTSTNPSVPTVTAIGACGTITNNVNAPNHNGGVDEVMFFNRSLSASEINSIYQNQSARYRNPASQLFHNINFTAGDNRVNVTTNSTLLLGSTIQLRLREINTGLNTTYQNITTGDNQKNIFNISNTASNLTLEFDFIPYNGNQSGNFYSPVLRDNIIIDTWSVEEAAGASNLVNLTALVSTQSATGRESDLTRNSIINNIIPAVLQRIFSTARGLTSLLKLQSVVNIFETITTNIKQLLNINSVMTELQGSLRNLVESNRINSVLTISKNLFRNMFSNIIINSILDPTASLTRKMSDNLQINSLVSRIKTIPINIVQVFRADTVIFKTGLFIRALIQPFIIFANSVSQTGAGANLVNLPQSLKINSVLTDTGILKRGLSENLLINSVVAKIRNVPILLNQKLIIGDSLKRTGFFFRAFSENVIISANLVTDGIARLSVGLVQNFIISPVLDTTAFFNRGASTNLIINALSSRFETITIHISNSLNPSAIVTRMTSLLRELKQNLIISSLADPHSEFKRLSSSLVRINSGTTTAVATEASFLTNVFASINISPSQTDTAFFNRFLSQLLRIIALLSEIIEGIVSNVGKIIPNTNEVPYVQLNETLTFD